MMCHSAGPLKTHHTFHFNSSIDHSFPYNLTPQRLSCLPLFCVSGTLSTMPSSATIFVDDQDPNLTYLCPVLKQKVSGAYYKDTWTSPQNTSCGNGWFKYTFDGESPTACLPYQSSSMKQGLAFMSPHLSLTPLISLSTSTTTNSCYTQETALMTLQYSQMATIPSLMPWETSLSCPLSIT